MESTDEQWQADGVKVPRSVERVLDVLDTVVSADGISLTEVADANKLTPTTALRYLRALEAREYVQRDGDGRYRPSTELQRIAALVRDGDPIETLIERWRPTLARLAGRTGETTYLAVREGDDARYVAAAESAHAIRHTGGVGQVLSLTGTAVGAAFGQLGKPAVVRGAVESDITAVSVALDTTAAISVVGPSHRMSDDVVADLSQLLATEFARVAPR